MPGSPRWIAALQAPPDMLADWRAWESLRDVGDAGRYIERIVDEPWTEHLRRW